MPPIQSRLFSKVYDIICFIYLRFSNKINFTYLNIVNSTQVIIYAYIHDICCVVCLSMLLQIFLLQFLCINYLKFVIITVNIFYAVHIFRSLSHQTLFHLIHKTKTKIKRKNETENVIKKKGHRNIELYACKHHV